MTPVRERLFKAIVYNVKTRSLSWGVRAPLDVVDDVGMATVYAEPEKLEVNDADPR